MKSKDVFQFKQFKIHQKDCEQKVGTDAVLLGAWTHCQKTKRILDIGTGTGIIALMLAQKSNAAKIDAIEIDSRAAILAKRNFNESTWHERLQLIHGSYVDIKLPNKKYDLIVSNPPYFEVSKKYTSRAISRQQASLTFHQLVHKTAQLLHPEGKFNIIIPYNEMQDFVALCKQQHLHLIRCCKVYGHLESSCKRVLLSFSFKNDALKMNSLHIELNQRHEYSKDYIELTKDYYLNF